MNHLKTKTKLPLDIKEKVKAFNNTIVPLAERFSIKDAVMQIPLDQINQIQIYIYEFKEKQYLDIRHYKYSNRFKKFCATKKGIRIPVEFLPQLSIRLNRLIKNQTFELKL